MATLEELVAKLEAIAARMEEAQSLARIEQKINASAEREGTMTVELDAIRTEIATLRSTQTEIADAITALAGRLTDNPTTAEVAAVAAELGEVAASFSGFSASLDSLDPAVAGGAVTEEPPA